jgi:hypothetical protein
MLFVDPPGSGLQAKPVFGIRDLQNFPCLASILTNGLFTRIHQASYRNLLIPPVTNQAGILLNGLQGFDSVLNSHFFGCLPLLTITLGRLKLLPFTRFTFIDSLFISILSTAA